MSASSASLVQLYCYDMSGGVAAGVSVGLIGRRVEGIWHTAIVAYGGEFYFDGGVGIVRETPGRTRFGQPQRTEVLGTTQRSEAEFIAWMQQKQRSGFGPNDYNLLSRNCNHFTHEAAEFLTGRSIPEDIREMIPTLLDTPLGRMLRPMLENIAAAPVSGGPPQQHVPGRGPLLQTAGLRSAKEQFTGEEEEDLMIALAMLQSNEVLGSKSWEGLNLTLEALGVLRSTLVDILNHPAETSYRALSTSDQVYKTKLLPLEQYGVETLLRLSGFSLRQHPSGTGHQWCLTDSNGSEKILRIVVSNLERTMDLVKAEVLEFASPATTNTALHEMPGNKDELSTEGEVVKSKTGQRLLEEILHDAVKPIMTFHDLLKWSPTTGGLITPAVPCRLRATDTSRQHTRLLICHDMVGGYTPGDYPHFGLCDPSSAVDSVLGMSYTVSYWHLVDYFVYFAHHRVSVPPKEWINAAHREGVPILGTFVSEWDPADICLMLQNAAEMSRVIDRLVVLCNTHNFDGYLINVETQLDKVLARHLLTFVALLRKTLNKRRPTFSVERVVIWYDAVTVKGKVSYQNALTPLNKPFFDMGNGLFTNYGWRPSNLNSSELLAGDRACDVYVGIDVFGRSGMYGGGGFASNVAAEKIAETRLSAAIFAPAWTLEVEGNKQRKTFLRSDAKLWSGLQDFFCTRQVEYSTLPVWSCFRSGVGKEFYVNGERVVGGDGKPVEWCQLSQTHPTPCYKYCESNAVDGPWCVLPIEEKVGGVTPVEWTTDAVWMGDRSLRFSVPPKTTVTLLRWKINLGGCGDYKGVLAFLDIVWRSDSNAGSKANSHWRRVCVDGISGTSTTRLVFNEESKSGGETKVIWSHGGWEIVRYFIPSEKKWSHVTSVSLQNSSEKDALRCTVGAVGFVSSSYTHWRNGSSGDGESSNDISVLMAGSSRTIPAEMFSVLSTKKPTTRVVEVGMLVDTKRPRNVLLFAQVDPGDGTSVSLYMGQHKVKPTILLPLHISPDATVRNLFVRDVSCGS